MPEKNVNKQVSSDVVWHHATATRARRENQHGRRGAILWFTGLSGAGKSTLAHAVEEELFQRGCHTIVLDDDNVHHGLCGDLGFSVEDRHENIRRVGEIAKLFAEAGLIVLTAFISPLRDDRRRVRKLAAADFIEIYCHCPIDVCEQRDVKRLYRRARRGEIREFTGISSPYEEPERPELVIETGRNSLEACVSQVMGFLARTAVIRPPQTIPQFMGTPK